MLGSASTATVVLAFLPIAQPEMESMIKQCMFAGAGADGDGLELGTVQERRERAKDVVHRMSEIQLGAHNAAEAELLATGCERNTDPVFVGRVLADLSSRIIVREKRVKP